MKLNLPQATSYIILQTAVISTKFEYLKTAGFGSIKELKSSHNAFQASRGNKDYLSKVSLPGGL